MKIIDLVQGSPAWHDFRRTHLGASDTPIIMGVSPWNTPFKLWQEKLGLKEGFKGNWATERGHTLESVALAEINSFLELNMKPTVAESEELPYQSSSYDGYDQEANVACEIKCPGVIDHNRAVEGFVPDKYFPQLQKQMYVGNFDFIYYFSYNGKNNALIKVLRDDKYIALMLQNEAIFWNCLQEMIAPDLVDADFIERNDTDWKEACGEYQKYQQQLKELESLVAEARNRIIALSAGSNSKGCGIRLAGVIRKGAVDYSKIEALKDMDLEAYRKPAIESYRITTYE